MALGRAERCQQVRIDIKQSNTQDETFISSIAASIVNLECCPQQTILLTEADAALALPLRSHNTRLSKPKQFTPHKSVEATILFRHHLGFRVQHLSSWLFLPDLRRYPEPKPYALNPRKPSRPRYEHYKP